MRVRNVKNKEEIIKNSIYTIENPKELKGKWKSIFNNNNPIYLEIGMGKGKFILENAKNNPNINYIGIEKNGSVLSYAIRKIEEYKLSNLKLICFDANKIDELFDKDIDLLYLNFSDPWPKNRHEKRRLTSNSFLEKYDKIFKKDRIIEMKTDNQGLFEYSIISFVNNGYKIEDISLNLTNKIDFINIRTEYEEKYILKNNIIYYLKVIKTC
jgi:tRNA (guanine-N7-)-methyltransferase